MHQVKSRHESRITNSKNSQRGATLSVVLCIIFVLVVIGIGLIFLIKLLGGGMEVRNANDAGILSVNKMAVKAPSVKLDTTNQFEKMFKYCLDDPNSGLNLGNYNSMVGAALLIALNAQADGSPDATANARKVLADLQGSRNSISAKLQQALLSPDWAEKVFNQGSSPNSVRMVGKSDSVTWNKDYYKTAYLESLPADSDAATNLAIDTFQKPYDQGGYLPQIYKQGQPAGYVSLPPGAASQNDPAHLRGYQALSISKDMTLMAVPIPLAQPHLVSQTTFDQHDKHPGEGKGIFVPPNGFKGGSDTAATAGGASAGKMTSTASGMAGLVGSQSMSQPPSVPFGYLVIDNSLVDTSPPLSMCLDNWDIVEGGAAGTWVDKATGAFANADEKRDLDILMNPNATPSDLLSIMLQDGDGNYRFYDTYGDPITSKNNLGAKFKSGDNLVLCTNQNSDIGSDSGGDCDCHKHTQPVGSSNLSPFDRAYHNPPQYVSFGGTTTPLTAAEEAKNWVWHLFDPRFRQQLNMEFNKDFGWTGLRLYPNNNTKVTYQDHASGKTGILPVPPVQYPYRPIGFDLNDWYPNKWGPGCFFKGDLAYGNPGNPGQITEAGTIEQLFNQTTSIDYWTFWNSKKYQSKANAEPSKEVREFIKQRMREIKPIASEQDFNQVLTMPVELGGLYYVYLQKPSDRNSAFVVSRTAPAWATPGTKADGTRHAFTPVGGYQIGTYPGLPPGSVVDCRNDYGIHFEQFTSVSGGPVDVVAYDIVSYQEASGAHGLLGTVNFSEYVSGSQQGAGSITNPPTRTYP